MYHYHHNAYTYILDRRILALLYHTQKPSISLPYFFHLSSVHPQPSEKKIEDLEIDTKHDDNEPGHAVICLLEHISYLHTQANCFLFLLHILHPHFWICDFNRQLPALQTNPPSTAQNRTIIKIIGT